MSKYSYDFKLEVVKYCLENHTGFYETAKHFGIPNKSPVQKWVRKFQENGPSGLIRNYHKYDGKFKKDVVEYMHANHLSLLETAIKFNLAGDYVVAKWERIYYEEGPQALYENKRGRPRKMSSKPRKKELDKVCLEKEIV